MNDPYAVLGVSRSATDEELTQAYRKLAKKYHPDMNPGDRSAERRMQEINAAYDQIKNERSGRASPSDSGGAGAYGPGSSRYGGGTGGGGRGGYDPFGDWFGGFGGFGDADWDEDGQEQNGGAYGPGGQNTGGAYGAGNAGNRGRSPKMVQVDLCVRSGYYQQALQILMNIDLSERDSEWFYYSAIANAGIGNRATALRHAQEAANLNPGNSVYAELLNRLERGGYAYRQTGASQGFDTRRFGRSILQCLFSPLFCICCCPRCLYFC